MASLSISKAWSETTGFVQREAGLVLPVAFLLVALPGAAMQYAMPTPPQPGIGFDFETWMRDVSVVLWFSPLVAALSLIGTIALSYLAIRPGRTVGDALQHGLRRFIFLFLAWLLIVLALAVAFVPLLLVIGVQAAAGSQSPGLVLLAALIYLVLIVAASIRLLLSTPVCAAESAGPIAIVMRSWALTRGHFWKLLGFVILFWLAALVAILAVSMMIGIVIAIAAGPPVPGSTGAFIVLLLTAVLQAIVTCLFTTMVSRIYVQLAGLGQDEIFA